MNISHLLLVGTGGFFGAIARYILSAWVAVRLQQLTGREFPYGTLFVNVTGSILLAVLGVWITRQSNWSEETRLLIGTGFLGAYTTFSTYANESIALIHTGNWQTGVGNIILMNVLCLCGVLFGLWLARQF